jgi:hypothetical protein
LIPGHGAPLTRADLDTYRAAFARLVACGAGAGAKAACSDGWLRDAAPLLGGSDAKFVRALVDYYTDSRLRGDAAKNAALCGG